jgi:hypothetical protein
MGDTAESATEISTFRGDSEAIEAATTAAHKISHWYPWTALPRLKAVEATRAQLESRVNESLARFQRKITRPSAVLAIRGLGDMAALEQANQIINAIHGQTESSLRVNFLQQKMQGLGSIIERKYAFTFGVISLYIGLLFAAVFGVVPIWQDWSRKQEGSVAAAPPAVPRVFLLQTPGSSHLAMLPVLFLDNAKGQADGWRAGIQLTNYDEQFLKSLVLSLRGCARGATSPAIALQVVGFSSSAEFRAQGNTLADSSRLNLETANRRALAVGSYLERIRDQTSAERWMEIEIHAWPTFDEMAKNRPYDDGLGGVPQQREQELLNRTAQVRLVSAGACEQLLEKEH